MTRLKPSSLIIWAIFHVAVAAAMVLIVSQIKVGNAYASLPAKVSGFITDYGVVYLLSMAVVGLIIWLRKGISLAGLVVVPVAIFGVYFVSILIQESFYSRSLLVMFLVLSVLGVGLSFLLGPKLKLAVAALLGVATFGLQTLGPRPAEYLVQALDLGPKPSVSRKVINTAMYEVEALRFKHFFDDCSVAGEKCKLPETGGGVALLGKGYLFATGAGKLYYFTFDQAARKIQPIRLPGLIPFNGDVYLQALGENSRHTFRVTDIALREQGGRFELFAAHHFWKKAEHCGVMRISRAQGDAAAFVAGQQTLEWTTLFETSPCLEAEGGALTRGGESGGRMAFVDDNTLMLTTGDYQHDGVDRKPMLAQDSSTSYGKTLLIDLSNGTSEIFSRGHRNPQGLFIDRAGVIWGSEHGPQGGDEINIIERDANYGWPLVTYGSQYGERVWPWNPHQGHHDGYRQPLYTWVHSVAISNLIRLEGSAFALWEGDFLVGTFKKKVFHFRVLDGRVMFVETLPLNGRIRDLLQDHQGRVLLMLDDGSVVFLYPRGGAAPAATGAMRAEALFARCSGCHKIADGSGHGIGPDLFGVVGRPVASAEGYGYSNALRGLSGVWDAQQLDAFLTNPAAYAPGTSMHFDGLPDAADRAAVIEYLQQ